MPGDAAPQDARVVRLDRQRIVIVCSKCLKRHDDGKAVRRALKAEVKARTKSAAEKRKTRIVKVSCLGLCPRGAVVLTSTPLLAGGNVVLVGTASEIAAAVEHLPHGRGDSERL